MPRLAAKLTAKSVMAKGAGRHTDGNNLHLLVKPSGARSWVFRYVIHGARHDLGIGRAGNDPAAVRLAEARQQAADLCRLVTAGTDPAALRKAEKAARAVVAVVPTGRTFRDVAKLYIAAHEAGWKNAKHAAQWSATLETYAFPMFGDLPVASVVTGHVMDALRPIWNEKPETAGRVRGRIEAVLDYATPLEWRSGPNPARWKGHLASMLPSRSKVAAVQHHAALPWGEIGEFMAGLAGRAGVAALALRFTILTAARTGETLGATWGEIDLAGKVWTIPGSRMKAGREHRVPLSEPALAVLAAAAQMRVGSADDAPVFQGQKTTAGLSSMALTMMLRRLKRADLTVHGFRSTFRDWCSEATAFDRDTAEAALAHTVRDKVEAAYRRGDQLEKRRRLMDAWGEYCMRPAGANGTGPVTAMRAAS